MNELWQIQFLVDAVLVFSIVFLLWRQRRGLHSKAFDHVTACLNVLEKRADTLDLQAQQYAKKMESNLAQLNCICEQASQLLKRSLETPTPATLEENELRAVCSPSPAKCIPTLREIEQTRERLQSEIVIDNELLLRGQLL